MPRIIWTKSPRLNRLILQCYQHVRGPQFSRPGGILVDWLPQVLCKTRQFQRRQRFRLNRLHFKAKQRASEWVDLASIMAEELTSPGPDGSSQASQTPKQQPGTCKTKTAAQVDQSTSS